MELLLQMNLLQLFFFVLLPGGAFMIAIFFAWDQCTKFDDQENYYEEEIKKLKAKIVELERVQTITSPIKP